jgi:hypothetical protein
MEHLRVHFARSRRVRIDDEFNGRTEELIEVEAGTHIVTLGPPHNFKPSERKVVLKNTTPLSPREIHFELDE